MNKGLQKLLFTFLLATVAAYSFHDIANLDIWYHLKSGELIFDRLEILRTNTFSYIAADHPSFNFYWLFQIFIHFVYRISGISGLILIKTAILAVSFSLLFAIRKKEDGYILPVFFLLLAVMAANGRFIIRPELASYFFLALYFYILHHYREHKGRLIYLLIPLQILWANMHGFWALGLFLVWAFVAGELILWKFRLPFEWKKESIVQENNITGNIFNNPAIGHYFTWRCFPERKVFLDGRFNFPERFLSHYYVPELWSKISEKYQIARSRPITKPCSVDQNALFQQKLGFDLL